MRILVINQFFSPLGGAEIIAYETYKLLKKNGHEVFFWATDKKPYFEENYEYSTFFAPYKTGTANYLRQPINYYYNRDNRNLLQGFIDKIKPDIIHIHNFSYFTYSILECCKNIPTVMTLHDSYIICPTGKLLCKGKICTNTNCQNGNFIHCIYNKCFEKNIETNIRRSILAKIGRNNLKYVNKFVTPSEALRELVLRANIGISEENILTINNFLTENDFVMTQPNYENKKYFLFVGRISEEKGVRYILEALKDIPKDIEIHIAGTGPEEDTLKQYAKNNNLYNVKFLGFKNREEIKEEYQNCIATILPCNWFENFPTTNMESFINGKPVIASNIGGIPEQVEHNKTGLLFDPGNVEELKDAILTYWNNVDLAKEHGRNAYIKTSEKYTEARYLHSIESLYETII